MADRECPQCHMVGRHKLQCSYRIRPIGSALDVEHMARTGEVREPPRSPFPPEVVERKPPKHLRSARDNHLWRRGYEEALSVVADYLRSEEARELACQAVRGAVIRAPQQEALWSGVADDVIAALLGEKP